MKIVFKLSYSNDSEKNLREDFCNFVVTCIADDIVNRSNIAKIKAISDSILSMNWVSWIGKPVKHINPYYLMNLIANNVEYEKLRKGYYAIQINPTVYYPNSMTKLERFVRFLDKGNLTVRGSHVFTEIFTKYTEQMSDLWTMYKSNKLKSYDIKNAFMIK